MKKLLTIFMFGIFMISLASAVNTLGTFEQDQVARLKQVCNDATYINISTVTYPNGSVAISNIGMTSVGNGEFAYNFTKTSTVGEYYFSGISDGCDLTFGVKFLVTPSGTSPDSIDPFVIVVFIFAAGLFFLIGNTFDKGKWMIKLSMQLLSMWCLVLSASMFKIMVGTSPALILVSNSFYIITIAISSVMTGYALVIATIFSIDKLKELRSK